MSPGLKKRLIIAASILIGIYFAYSVYSNVAGEGVPANTRQVMDAETGKLFSEEMRPGLGPYPHVNPKTGKKTLYPIEWCYNGPCGKKGGTPVILDPWLERAEPTYCPECGHVVRFHNPRRPLSERR